MRETASAVQKDQDYENPVSPVEEAFGENPGLRLGLFQMRLDGSHRAGTQLIPREKNSGGTKGCWIERIIF